MPIIHSQCPSKGPISFTKKKRSNFGPFGHVKIVHSNKGQDKAFTLHCAKCVQPWFNVWEFHVWVRLRVRVSAMLTGKFLQICMIRKVSRWSANYRYDLKSIRMIWKCLNDMKRALLCRHIYISIKWIQMISFIGICIETAVLRTFVAILTMQFRRSIWKVFAWSCSPFWLCGVVCGHLELFVQSSLVTSRPSKSFRKNYKKNYKM